MKSSDIKVGQRVKIERRFPGVGACEPGKECPHVLDAKEHAEVEIAKAVEAEALRAAANELDIDTPIGVNSLAWQQAMSAAREWLRRRAQ